MKIQIKISHDIPKTSLQPPAYTSMSPFMKDVLKDDQ